MKVKWLKSKAKAERIGKKKKQFVIRAFDYDYFGKKHKENFIQTVYAVVPKEDAKIIEKRSFIGDALSKDGILGKTGCLVKIIWAPEKFTNSGKVSDNRIFPEF